MNIIYHFRVKGVGPERVHISGISGAFENHGYKVTFVSPTNINPLKSGDVVPQKGLVRSILYFIADKTPQVCFETIEIIYNIVALLKLKKQIIKIKPKAIYERYAFFCVSGVYLSKKLRIPVILEVNEVSGFDRVRPQKLIKLCKCFEKYIFANADIVVTVSDFLKEQVVNRGGDRDRILVVPNGIDTQLFNIKRNSKFLKNKLGINNKKILGFVGYLVHWHRLDVLMEVFAKLHAIHKDIVLMFVGDGVLRNELEMKASLLGIEDSFIVTGRVDHSDVPNYIDIFDIALIPNSNEYRSPIKLFEYMAMGKAIIAPDQPPIMSVINDEQEGFIFKNGDVESLYSKIEYSIRFPDHCAVVGGNAKKLVNDKYTWNCHVKNILNFLYEKCFASMT